MAWRWGFKRRGSAVEHDQSFAQFQTRFAALEHSIEAQNAMIDQRTRVMAEAMSTELRALGRIMADLARNMAELNAKVVAQAATVPAAPARFAPLERGSAPVPESPLMPPPPANDPPPQQSPAHRRDIDPLLLEALAKGRVAFDVERISSIPPRVPHLALMRFAEPLPEIDDATIDRLAELFPDAALLLDRFMLDAADSRLRSGQIAPDLPVLIPVSPLMAREPGMMADLRQRFERLPRRAGVVPLLSEAGWIALVEAHADGSMPDLAGTGTGFALRVSGRHRIDPVALGQLGVRYVVADAAMLAVPEHHPLAPDIHPTDVARLFSRAGIGLVAENVGDQVTVLGLLRNNVTMGWGPALNLEPLATAASDASMPVEAPDYRSYLRRAGS